MKNNNEEGFALVLFSWNLLWSTTRSLTTGCPGSGSNLSSPPSLTRDPIETESASTMCPFAFSPVVIEPGEFPCLKARDESTSSRIEISKSWRLACSGEAQAM